MMLKKIKSRTFWKRGEGELLGFVYTAPFILMLICCITAASQIGIVNQQLNYCAYNACRSAAVSETQTIGKARAQELYYASMGNKNAAEYGYVPCEIEVLDNAGWEKGSYIRCTVRYYVSTLMPFTSGVREQSVVMMIENGETDL